MADGVDHRVDIVVAQRLALLGGLQLGGDGEVIHGPAHLGHQHFHRAALTGTGIAHIDAHPPQILEILDAGIGARDNGEGLGMDREDGPQVFERALLLEPRGAVIGVILPVGLRHAELKLAAANGVDVEDRTAGRFHTAADAMLGPVAVDHPADRAAGRVIDAGHTARADGDESVLRGDSASAENRRGRDKRANKMLVHDSLPEFFILEHGCLKDGARTGR